jgi:hypothetical protein
MLNTKYSEGGMALQSTSQAWKRLLAGGAAYFIVGMLNKNEPDREMLEKCF